MMFRLQKRNAVLWSLVFLMIQGNGTELSGSGFVEEGQANEQAVSFKNISTADEEVGWILTSATGNVGEEQQELLQEAIVSRNARRVKQLLTFQNNERFSQEGDDPNKTISHLAAENEFLAFLTDSDLAQHYEPETLDVNGESPCCYAAKAKKGIFFGHLLEMGREIFLFGNCSYGNGHYGPTLHTAFYYNRQHLSIDSLSKNLASIKETLLERDSHGYSLLHVLSMNTSPTNEAATKLLGLFVSEHTEDHLVEARDNKGRTPFLSAAVHGAVQYAEFLRMETSSDPSAVDSLGYSAFHLTSSKQFLDYLLKIPNLKFNVNSKSRHLQGVECDKSGATAGGMTPLHIAVKEKKQISYIKFVLNYMDITDMENQCGQSPLLLAVDVNYSAAIRLFLSGSSAVAANAALSLALDRRNVEAAKLILFESKDIGDINRQRDESIGSALHEVAATPKLSELSNLLLKRGADTSIYNKAGLTPLLLAVLKKNWAVAKSIIEQRDTNDLADKTSLDTALHFLAKVDGLKNDSEHRPHILNLTSLLIQKNTSTSSFNKFGLTPLLVAVKGNNFDIAKVIVENDHSSINLPENGTLDTPLHVIAGYIGDDITRNEEVAVLMIKKGADTSAYNAAGSTPLFTAIIAKRSSMVKLMIENNDQLAINLPSQNVPNYTPLHHLVAESEADYENANSSSELAALLVQKGANASIYSQSGVTPLLLAIKLGSFDIAKLMVENDQSAVSLPIRDSLDTPLHLVANYNGENSVVDELADLLVIKGANCAALYNQKGLTPLHAAILNNNFRIAKLIARNSNATMVSLAVENSLDTPLHLLAGRNASGSNTSTDTIELCSMLLEKGAKTKRRNKDGLTPLLVAIERDNFELAKLIAKSGDAEMINVATDDTIDTALHLMAGDVGERPSQQSNELVLLLLTRGAKTSSYNAAGLTPLILAILSSRFDIAKSIIEVSDKSAISLADKNTLNTPLHLLADFGQETGIELAALLVKKGADTSLYNKDGLTSLIFAIEKKRYDIARIIIEHSSQNEVINLVTNDTLDSPLHLLIKSDNNTDLVNALIVKGANVCHFNKNGMTALHSAIDSSALQNAFSIANSSSQSDCPNQQTTSTKDTALHLSAREMSLFKLLKLFATEKEADVFIQNKRGQTPLHVAIIYENFEAAKFLLDLNRSGVLQVVDSNKRNPLHLAVGNTDFVRLIIEYGKTAGIVNNLLTPDVFGDTPLFRAVAHHNIQTSKILLEVESCSTLNKHGQTPLHYAHQLGYFDLADLMVRSGRCKPNQTNSCHILPSSVNPNTVLGCGQPPDIENGAVAINGSCVNSVAAITCDAGFSLVGSNEITCLPNGRWQISGYCKSLCDPMPNVANAELIGDAPLRINVARNLTCTEGFTLFGSPVVTCSDGGNWLIQGFCEKRFFIPNCASCNWGFEGANAACHGYAKNGRGARLATIRNSEDSTLACSLARELNSRSLWIGLYRRDRRRWAWSDGSEDSFTNWHFGEPSNSGGNEDVVQITLRHQDCGWNDVSRTGGAGNALCEYYYITP